MHCFILTWKTQYACCCTIFQIFQLDLFECEQHQFNDTFVICRWQLIKNLLPSPSRWDKHESLYRSCLSSKHTHISRCVESTAESLTCLFPSFYKLYRVTSIPHICSAHGKAHQRPSLFTSAWKHQPLSVVTFLSTSLKRPLATEAFMCWE